MADVKLFRPQRLTDNPDGGGLATATEIIDGQVNNLFDDISRIDRVNGELSLRKAFAQAATADTELYSDLHVIVQSPPQDPRVAAVLFRTNSWSDERDAAKAQVERYLDESVISRMIPYDRQLQGQRTVLVYQRPELSLPEIGEVYALKVDATEVVEYVRVSDMSHQVETFTDASGDYQVRVITLTISQPLSVEFAGSQPNRFFTVDAGKSVIRKTIASDAARYKGVVELAQDAQIGDLTIKVQSVFAQLVPSATSEVAVVDAMPAGAELVLPAAESVYQTVTTNVLPLSSDAAGIWRLPVAAAAGSLVLNLSGAGTWTEQADGSLLAAPGSQGTFAIRNRSELEYAGLNAINRQFTVEYVPGAVVARSAQTFQVPVQIQNRGYVYVATLRPPPTPGSTVVSFRALGQWFTLEDDGSGALVGDAGVGTGLINFQTGSVQLTLGALPDIGSSVVYAWGASSEYQILDGDVDIQVPAIEGALATGNCEPGTLSLSWPAGGVTKTATDNGSGVITGDGAGRVVYSTGEFILRPALLPDSTAVVTAGYSGGALQQDVFAPSLSAGNLLLSLSSAPVRPGSLSIDYNANGFSVGTLQTVGRRITDDGLGQLMDSQGAVVAGSSINYTTGAISFDPGFTTPMASLQRTEFGNALPGRAVSADTGYFAVGDPITGSWPAQISNEFITAFFQNGAAVTARYKVDAAVDDVITGEQIAVPALKVDLTPKVRNAIIPGSLLFKLGGRTYYDRQGVLYYGMAPATGAGTAAGTIDYTSGVAAITSWVGNIAPSFDVVSLLSEVSPLPLAVVHGRTPGSPLRPGTFSIQANLHDGGTLVSAVSDNNGNLDTTDMHGYVDVNTGVFAVAFGRYVLASGLTADELASDWYDVDYVDADGYIWRPREAIPGTVRFNAVVQTSLPQDPEIIKVNPVRLPMDGRVQILRAGDTLVLHDTQAQTLPNPLSAGQMVAIARTGVESIALYDQVGLGVDPALYVFGKETDDVTFATPLDLSAYTQPLVLLHTIEDMALCLDAQITGEVSLGHALTHGYTAANSLVSSALILGDAQARYQSLFAQATWTNVWSDALIGAAPSSGAQYNDATYPVEVLNRDAITQRWRLQFTSSTAYNIVGEEVGVIGTGTISTDAAPLNPATGLPYFRVVAAGFGTGWATGNAIRFNTVAAGGPFWNARTVLSGPASNQDDLVRLQLRWDKD